MADPITFELSGFEVYRGPTFSPWTYENWDFAATRDADCTIDGDRDLITVTFSIPSKGGGYTTLRINLGPETLADMAQHHPAAVRMFAEAIASSTKSSDRAHR